MNENDAKQVTWDLMIAVRRLNGNKHHDITDDPRHERLADLHGTALERFGHGGFNA